MGSEELRSCSYEVAGTGFERGPSDSQPHVLNLHASVFHQTDNKILFGHLRAVTFF